MTPALLNVDVYPASDWGLPPQVDVRHGRLAVHPRLRTGSAAHVALPPTRVVYVGDRACRARGTPGEQSGPILGRDSGAGRTIPPRRHSGRPHNDSQRRPRLRVRPMKLNYHPDTDSLYIDLSEQPSAERREVSAGIVLAYDADGNLVGIDIDNARRKVRLEQLVLSLLDASIERIAGQRTLHQPGGTRWRGLWPRFNLSRERSRRTPTAWTGSSMIRWWSSSRQSRSSHPCTRRSSSPTSRCPRAASACASTSTPCTSATDAGAWSTASS